MYWRAGYAWERGMGPAGDSPLKYFTILHLHNVILRLRATHPLPPPPSLVSIPHSKPFSKLFVSDPRHLSYFLTGHPSTHWKAFRVGKSCLWGLETEAEAEAEALTGSTGTGEATRGAGPPPPTDPGDQPIPSTRGILTAEGAARPAAEAAGGVT
jgi:hypothetical protein